MRRNPVSVGAAALPGVLPSPADEELGETDDLGPSGLGELGHGLLLVPDEGLLEEHPLLVPGIEPALDNLRPGRLGLALGLGDVEEGLALLLDGVGRGLV